MVNILVPKVIEFAEQDFDDLEDDEILDIKLGIVVPNVVYFST